jgi:hypothetical protein
MNGRSAQLLGANMVWFADDTSDLLRLDEMY